MAKFIKIGNTHFNTELLAFSTKKQFLAIYSDKMLAKDLDKAWNELRKYIKIESKPKEERSKVEHNYKKEERG